MSSDDSGIIILAAYAIIVNPVAALGYPKTAGQGITALVVLLPVELGIIYYQSYRQSGCFSIKKMISHNKRLSLKSYLVLVPLLFGWTVAVLVLGQKIDEFVKTSLFSWIPEWYALSVDYVQYSKPELLVTFISAFFLTGIIVPAVEEIYFRGFLLPRMEWLGNAAPVIYACLFALYHFWSPWQTPVRVIALIPLCYDVNRTKNTRIAVIVHCVLNISGDALGLLLMLVQ